VKNMNKKTIIVVTETMGVDGPERVLSALVDEWYKTGYNIKVVVTRAELRDATYKINTDIDIHYIDAHAKGGTLSRYNEAKELRKFLKKNPDAICVSLMVSTSFSLAMASIGLKNRIILSERNDPSQVPFTKIQRKMRDLSLALADSCVFQTEDAKAYFSKRIQKKGVIIHNPINPALPERFDGERRKVFVAAGRLAKQKNYPVMLQAFAEMVKEHPEYKLVICGEGPERKDLEQKIQILGISDKVEMPGFFNDVYHEMVDCIAYVSSSDYEGMSNSMLEALAMGMPVICTDCPIGGARTVINNRQNGLLVPVGDSEAFCQAMKYIIENPEATEHMGMQAYELRKRLNIHDIAKEWEKLF